MSLGEDFTPGKIDDNTYTARFRSAAGPIFIGNDPNQAGLRSISFNAVPEPSSALLSGIALLGLLKRRR
ncbi:PEP-CTERM sorting domain-containing protein [Akkermansiaceae bacterium]|nr:PEP-CTERM sorting domain-containing protein [Akkermansiaceae bacterium]MDB4436189.1 PEP-CTERM sorting domain-containing protein [Akkermansiaceae bacterium]